MFVLPRRIAPTTPNQRTLSQYRESLKKLLGVIAAPARALAKRLRGINPAHNRLLIDKRTEPGPRLFG